MKRLTEKDIKPCPMCGGEVVIGKSPITEKWYIGCIDLGCLDLNYIRTKTKAIELWNSIRIDDV